MKIKKLTAMIAVVLIAMLCFFLPNVKAQQPNYKDEVIHGSQLEKTLLGIVLMYDQYKRDCYADSSEHTFNMYIYNYWSKPDTSYSIPSKYEIDPGVNMNFRGTVKRWVHKETTFEGFIEWLRKIGEK